MKDGLNQDDGGRRSKKWLGLGPGLEMELTELTHALAAKGEGEKKKVKDDSSDFGLNHCIHGRAIY